jgi:hypothetical protein
MKMVRGGTEPVRDRGEREAGEGVSRGEEDEEEGSGVVVMVGGSKGGTVLCLSAAIRVRCRILLPSSLACGG